MALTSEQQKLVIDKLNAKWPQPRVCPMCKISSDWELGMLGELRPFDQGNLIVGGPVVPLVSVSCRFCANVQFFNAIKLGIIDAKDGRFVGEAG